MKATGMIRKVDELGRVVIPKEIRKKLEIYERDPLDIYVDGHSIILKKVETNCIFCDSNKSLLRYKNKLVCKKCFTDLSSKNIEEI